MIKHIKKPFDFSKLPNNKLVLVPHICNDMGVMGAGFARQVRCAVPSAFKAYRAGGTDMGTISMAHKENTVVVNMIAQRGLIARNNPEPIRYPSLYQCMRAVSRIYDDKKFEIHTIKFGSGLAGGSWELIEKAIKDIWSDIPVFIYTGRRS